MKAFNDIMMYFANETQLQFVYNYMLSKQPEEFAYYINWLQTPEVGYQARKSWTTNVKLAF